VDAPGSGQFLNMVALVQATGSAFDLLDRLMQIEAGAGRERTTPGAPRTLDLDLLLMGDLVLDDPRLTLPHPRMWQRSFVLEPLAEIAPELVNRMSGRTVTEECREARGGPAVRRVLSAAQVEQDLDSILRLGKASTYNPADG
jgi:7,8-dihydro-6-hydroxymethylpterin-pyrophosphokinase